MSLATLEHIRLQNQWNRKGKVQDLSLLVISPSLKELSKLFPIFRTNLKIPYSHKCGLYFLQLRNTVFTQFFQQVSCDSNHDLLSNKIISYFRSPKSETPDIN